MKALSRKQKNHGVLPDKKDNRDVLLSACETPVKKIPLAVFNEPSQIYAQKWGSCTGWGTATMGTILEDYESNKQAWSGRAIYALNKKIDGIPNQEGSYGRIAMKNWQEYGLFKEKDLPNDSVSLGVYQDWSLLSLDAYKRANTYKIDNYAKVDYDIRQAIYNHRTAGLSIPWYYGSYHLENGIIKNTGKLYGGHWICCCGYISASQEDYEAFMRGDKDIRPLLNQVKQKKVIEGDITLNNRYFLILANSHSRNYGINGFALYPDNSKIWNKWTVISLPNDWKIPPVDLKYNINIGDWDLIKMLPFTTWIWLLTKLKRFPTKREFYALTAGRWGYDAVFDKNNQAHLYIYWIRKDDYLKFKRNNLLTGKVSDIIKLRNENYL